MSSISPSTPSDIRAAVIRAYDAACVSRVGMSLAEAHRLDFRAHVLRDILAEARVEHAPCPCVACAYERERIRHAEDTGQRIYEELLEDAR